MPDPEDQNPIDEPGNDDAGATEGTEAASEFAQPSTEDLANELTELEEAAETATETAPDSDPEDTPEPETPADPEPPAEPEADPEPPAADPEKPDDAPDPPDRTIASPVKSAQAEKKASDKDRREALIASQPAVDMSAFEAEEERKAELMDKLAEVQAEQLEAEEFLVACKSRTRELMAELYPHTAQSDKLVDAVRGHIAAQKKVRAHRASNPARIAEILKQAGKAPIDAAFHRQRARGMTRPTRTPMRPGGAAEKPADQSGDGSNANAGSE